MVIMKSNTGRQILKPNDTNRLNSEMQSKFKAKLGKSNSKNVNNILSSPSKTPLTSSSLANIYNGSPSKKPIHQLTPKKLNQSTTTNQESSFKISSPKLKLTPIKLEKKTYDNQHPYNSPSSTESDSPTSIKQEEEYPPSPSNEVYPTNQTLLDAGSIIGDSNSADSSCRKRITAFSAFDDTRTAPPVSRRNARERNRVKQVSMGFAILRQHVPQGNRKKKLSKVETLRCAVEYIKNLQSLLQENPISIHTSSTTIQHKTQTSKYNLQGLQSLQGIPTDQYHQVPINSLLHSKQEENFHFNGGKLSSLQHPYQNQNSSPETYYEDRVLLQQMSNGSCLDAHVLKVPKVEEHFQTSEYLPSYCPSTYGKGPSSNSHSNSTQNGCIDEGPVMQENKDPLGPLPADLPEYFTSFPQKDTGESDLMEALAWWQQNS